MSFPRYPHYKASGVEWLGEVPVHWDVMSLRRCTSSVQTGGTPSSEPPSTDLEKGLVWYTPGDFGDSLLLTASTRKISPAVVASGEAKVFPPRSILIVSIGATLGKVGFAEEASSANQQINAVIPNDRIDGYFLAYSLLVKSEVMRFLSNASTIGIMNQEKTKDISTTVPPLPEQTAIAAFLDRETAKIDALISEYRQLMALLKEKRQAVISHAVTKGLNPNAPMKDSGIEWLGEVPEHWVMTRIANLFHEVSEAGTDELPILSVSIHHGVSDKEIEDEDMDRKVTRSDDRSKYKQVTPGDLVYNMMRAWQGGFGTVTVAGMVSPAYVVARPKIHLETAFIEHLLRTPQAIEQMRRHSRGVTDFRLRLYWDEFKNIRVALPCPDESVAISHRPLIFFRLPRDML
ncbi:type I restriction enzyme, S subunit [Gammaproteobacteria bacterium]